MKIVGKTIRMVGWILLLLHAPIAVYAENEVELLDMVPIEKKMQEGLEPLKEQVSSMLSGWEGDWSVYVAGLNDSQYLEINNHAMKSASVIKLFIMGAVLEQVEQGNLQEDEELDRLLNNMITVSDNESSNELVRRLSPDGTNHPEGMKIVNAFAQEHHFPDTSQGRDMLDVRVTPAPGENYTSVVDCGNFLREVYEGKMISPERSEQMLSLLKMQQRTWKIPAGLPEGTVCANKTGELSDTENDSAIVYSPGQDYILCVMATNLPETGTAQSRIVSLSQTVYDYFN